ncbi:MAG: adenylate/guanylate cyclase domain-containing protein [Desulfatirhabdiaceae bacterium]
MFVMSYCSLAFLELMELKAWDLHFLQRGKLEPSGMTAFVGVDEDSVNRIGRWPWPRRKMAELIQAVEHHGASVIGLDMGFFEPDLKLRQQAILDIRDKFQQIPGDSPQQLLSTLETMAAEADDDMILATTIRELSIPLVLGHFFYFDPDAFIPSTPPDSVLEKARCPLVRVIQEPAMGRLAEAVGLETNIPLIEASSLYMGSFNVFADPDGTVRWMPLVFRYENHLFPSLSLQVLSAVFPDRPVMIIMDSHGIQNIRLGSTDIPTNNRGEILLNYYGPAYTFPYFSAVSLLNHEIPDNRLSGRMVIIGNTTVGLHDMRPTPFSEVFPGVELHCNVIENIIQQNFLSRSDRNAPLIDIALLILSAGFFLILNHFTKGLYLAGGVTILFLGHIGLTHYAFLDLKLWLNHVYPLLNLTVIYLGTSIHEYLIEEREKRRIRQTFSLYVHETVVDEMLKHPDMLRLGGEKKELTVLFSDIRGFTSLSEKLPPESLVTQLNEYLTQMSQVVFDNYGTLDKYIGDAVMAIFGAPLPQKDHSEKASATALDMIERLKTLQNKWRQEGKPILEIGVGVNTGPMIVGNMGSERRFDYTVLGDNVNLASRLEGLTKMYGVSIIVSESTWNAAQSNFFGREIDRVRVKGKLQPVGIYQVMARKSDGMFNPKPLETWNAAIQTYRNQDWAMAITLFDKVKQDWPDDPPSQLYQSRCQECLLCSPGPTWDCVTTLDHK